RAGDLAVGSSLSMLFRGVVSNRILDGGALPALAGLVDAERDAQECNCSLIIPAEYFFRIDFRNHEVTIAQPIAQPNHSEAPSGWAAAKVGSFVPRPTPALRVADDGKWLARYLTPARAADGIGFSVMFANRGDSVRAIGFAPQRDEHGKAIGMLGFVASPQEYASALFTHLWKSARILPSAVTHGIPNDSLLTASVSIPGGNEIYRSSGWERQLLSDTASLATFGGGLRVRVALRRDAIARLGTGLVPVSRVPVWVGLLVLTALLTGIILRNLQREHELARLRADFTASVSHELRTPLAQILLFGETLTLGRTRSESERTRAAGVIVREARRLMQMVENALQYSRANRPEIEVSAQRLRLAPEIREAIAAFEPLGDTRGVRIVADLDEHAQAEVDRAALRQIVLNLLDNALKYGPPEQTISVGLSGPQSKVIVSPAMLAPDQQQIRLVTRIWVDDEGPGIPQRMREALWAPFVRGDTDSSTGCGLGLAVVRDLAARHSGKAWVENTPTGRGSRFIVELPALSSAIMTDDGGGRDDGGSAPVLTGAAP
ncbi:MAG TPA: HAMP domain-containing sensor histidine kinase, partial [Gemmatimonadaceae bacterium]|nr:HAMP domain-containing sensor histidine kinase [Gemmatimonadaceae bacterium]